MHLLAFAPGTTKGAPKSSTARPAQSASGCAVPTHAVRARRRTAASARGALNKYNLLPKPAST